MRNSNIFSIIVLLFTSIIFISCNESPNENDDSNDLIDSTETISADADSLKTTDNIASELIAGQHIYNDFCLVCHLENGQGIEGNFPPLAKSDYLLADKLRAIKTTIYGSKEPITVNGIEYSGGMMTITELSDEQVKSVVNFILNSWGNNGGEVTLEEVKKVREENK